MKWLISTLFFCLYMPLSVWAYTININEDSAEALAAGLKGVGVVKAEAIVNYREKNGPFKNVDDLVYVRGISTKTVDKNRSSIGLTAE